MAIAIAVIGWAAAVTLLVAYRLVTTGRIRGESLTYLALNMFGSAGLGLSTTATHSWPSAANNVIWLVLGVAPLTKALRIRVTYSRRLAEPHGERPSAAAIRPRERGSGHRRGGQRCAVTQEHATPPR